MHRSNIRRFHPARLGLGTVCLALVVGGLACSSDSTPSGGAGGAGGMSAAGGRTGGGAGGTSAAAGGSVGSGGNVGSGGSQPGSGGNVGSGGAGPASGGQVGTDGGPGTGGNSGGVDAPRDVAADVGGKADSASDAVAGTFVLSSSTLVMRNTALAFPASASAPMNQSPALAWSGAPAGTMSFAVSVLDVGRTSTHWIIWDIPASTTMLPANLPRGAMPAMPAGTTQKSAFGGMPGDQGPGAEAGDYEIKVWALSVAKLPPSIANQALGMMLSTGLPSVQLGSAKLTVRGQRGGF